MFKVFLYDSLIEFINLFQDKFKKHFKNLSTLTEFEYFLSSKFFKIFIIFLIFFFVISAIYNFCFLITKSSSTIGQKILRLSIVNEDGSKISKKKALFRSVIMVIPWIYIFFIFFFNFLGNAIQINLINPILFLISLILFGTWFDVSLYSKKHLVFHDIITKTVVVSTNKNDDESQFSILKNLFVPNFKENFNNFKAFAKNLIDWSKKIKEKYKKKK